MSLEIKGRKAYEISIVFNSRHIRKVIIDHHYKLRHSEMNDALILNLVKTLAGLDLIEDDRKEEFAYYKYNPIIDGKLYRLIFTLSDSDNYVGVINAFRIRSKK